MSSAWWDGYYDYGNLDYEDCPYDDEGHLYSGKSQADQWRSGWKHAESNVWLVEGDYD